MKNQAFRIINEHACDIDKSILLIIRKDLKNSIADRRCENEERHVVIKDILEYREKLRHLLYLINHEKKRVIESDAFESIEGEFEHILTNPPLRAGKQVIYGMFDESFRRLTPGGTLTIVIRKQQGAPSAKAHLQEKFDHVEVIAKEKSYWIIECKKEAE